MMYQLTMSFAKAINKQRNRVGPLFQGRFESKHIEKNEYLLHLSRYIHLNPVKAGLVKKAEEWEYSSYREYIGLRNGTLPHPGIVLSQFANPKTPGFWQTPGVYHAYKEFVESYSDRDLKIIEDLLLE